LILKSCVRVQAEGGGFLPERRKMDLPRVLWGGLGGKKNWLEPNREKS